MPVEGEQSKIEQAGANDAVLVMRGEKRRDREIVV